MHPFEVCGGGDGPEERAIELGRRHFRGELLQVGPGIDDCEERKGGNGVRITWNRMRYTRFHCGIRVGPK